MKEILIASVDTCLQVILITSIFHRFKANNRWFKCISHDFLHPGHGAWEKKGHILMSCPFFTFPSLCCKTAGSCFSSGHLLLIFCCLHFSFHPSPSSAAVTLSGNIKLWKMDSRCFTPFSTVFKQWKIKTKAIFQVKES